MAPYEFSTTATAAPEPTPAGSLTGPAPSFTTTTDFFAAAVWRESTVAGNYDPSCTPYILPSLGLVGLQPNTTLTLQAEATFTPACYINDTLKYLDSNDSIGPHVPQSDLRDPFYASTIPMAYAIGGTAVLAYILMFILLISPPGSRPLLQKAATLTVVISLTIAWAEFNDIVQQQHSHGYSNGAQIRLQILRGIKIQITRVISDTFLYLAQVQTLIRLFPRHREKLVIKWAGIVLIVLDTVFNVINNFFSKKNSHKGFLDAIPALSYLLQIALSLLYACCVLYYMFSHRQFSVMMPWSINNQHKHAGDTSKVAMPLIAVVTTGTIFTPLVFFVLDISNQDLAGWGDFVRWIGACAASVIVWEMADRIERFERLTIHAGILGRQVFEGDEMLQGIGGRVVDWGDRRSFGNDRGDGPGGGGGGGGSGGAISGTTAMGRPIDPDEKHGYTILPESRDSKGGRGDGQLGLHSRPTPPLSRATTGSTMYVIRVHPNSVTPPPVARPSSTVSRSSSTRDTNRGTSTISDLVISPADTPSNETGTHPPRSRNITFSDDTPRRSSTDTAAPDQSITLSHTYRPGQAPFNPEDFSAKDQGSKSHLVFRKGIGFLKRFRLDDNKEVEQAREKQHALEFSMHLRHEAALGHQIVYSEHPINHVAAQPSETGDDTFGDHHSVDPGVRSRSSNSQVREGGSQFQRPTENSHPQQSLPQERHNNSFDEEDRPSGPSSFFRGFWSRKPKSIQPRGNEPLPVTYIPAVARGNHPVNPNDVEEARNRERERIRSGESSSEGTSSPSNASDGIITKFEAVGPNQRISRESPLHASVSPASAPRARQSVEFDLPADSAIGFSSSPHHIGHRVTRSQGSINTPPPPPTRSTTASPTGSVRTTSTGSWQYRASPNNGAIRMNPVTQRASYNQTPENISTQPSVVIHPEITGPSVLTSSPSVPKTSSAPTKHLGRPLDPVVIPEEAEGSSMASLKGVESNTTEHEPEQSSSKGKSVDHQ